MECAREPGEPKDKRMRINDRETVRMTALRATELLLRSGKGSPSHESIQGSPSPLAGRDFSMQNVNFSIVGPDSGPGHYHVLVTMSCLGYSIGSACVVLVTADEVNSADVHVYVNGKSVMRCHFEIYNSDLPGEIILNSRGMTAGWNHFATLSR